MTAVLRKTRGTISAIATAPGEGGIGIVRLSGERAIEIASKIFRSRSGRPVTTQKSFTMSYGHVLERTSASGGADVIDEALLSLMRSPASYTGEDVVEINVHGGSAVLQAVMRRTLEEGALLAEPGEFTKRAFLNGRIDLLQAEAVLDLVRAKTDRVRDWATSQLSGRLSDRMRRWKDELLGLLADLEAEVDFPDDRPETMPASMMSARLGALSDQMRELLRDSELAFVAKRGFQAVLCGRPNVGKSSLMNRLCRADRAIVTPYPGTTRDVVEHEISIEGLPVRMADTAGIRDAEHPVEKEGVDRSKRTLSGADLILWVLDRAPQEEEEEVVLMRQLSARPGVVVWNKSDLGYTPDLRSAARIVPSWPQVRSSALTDDGLRALEDAMKELILKGRVDTPGEVLLSSARQKVLLEKASSDLSRAAQAMARELSPEFAAADVRSALDALGEVVGEVFNEDMLDILFRQFCIGK